MQVFFYKFTHQMFLSLKMQLHVLLYMSYYIFISPVCILCGTLFHHLKKSEQTGNKMKKYK